MFQNLPLELLTQTIGYVFQPSHLKALCLVSKTVSSIATRFLYRNLVLDFPLLTAAGENDVGIFDAVLMSDGLKFVKTLKVGPLQGKTIALFDRLMYQFQDHSLVDFEWDSDEPPFYSQFRYIWDHQWNIQSIDLTKMANTVRTLQPCKGFRFPQKYAHLSLSLPLEEDLSKKLDLASMTTLTVIRGSGESLPLWISPHIHHITNLQLHQIYQSAEDLKLDHFTSLTSLGLYRCSGSGPLLSNFKNPKLKHFHIECNWPDFDVILEDYFVMLGKEQFEAQFSFIRSFEGLETLVIHVPDQRRHPATLLKNLVDSISLNHNDTLRHLALLDPCKPNENSTYTFDRPESRRSLYAAVTSCRNLVQLELPTAWETKEMDFKQLTDDLPSLKFLCLRFHVPWDPLPPLPGLYRENKLPTMIWTGDETLCELATSLICDILDESSKLKLLTFEIRGHGIRRSFARGWSHRTNRVSDSPCSIREGLVKYHIFEYEPMPTYAREVTWKTHCQNNRPALEEGDGEFEGDILTYEVF